jgi:hypothetical protein
MHKSLQDIHLKAIGETVAQKIYAPSREKVTSIFLCGADIKDTSKARYKLAQILKNNKKFEILYPEDIFDDLLAGQGHSLLTLESLLAESVDAIVIFPESAGSLVEVGAFANDEQLRHKLICLAERRYQRDKSFINFGPFRLIKASKSASLLQISYSDFDDEVKADLIYSKLSNAINRMKKNNPTRRHIGNLLEAENFILPCIYLVQRLKIWELAKILEIVTNQDRKYCEVATRSALGRLLANRYVTRDLHGYAVTQEGAKHVRSSFGSKSLDRARLEVMNFELRHNSSINCARM